MTMENMRTDSVAGIVLAGGNSSRMGKNKALLDFYGTPLVEHMMALLDSCGIRDVFISGTVENYPCLPDKTPFGGPAVAMADCLNDMRGDYDGILFVPVDMPFLTPALLKKLLGQNQTCYFKSKPLPAYIRTQKVKEGVTSVQQLLSILGAGFVPLTESSQKAFSNINTPEEWREVV
jgi:molybdenum cofactor guanylyltransferase